MYSKDHEVRRADKVLTVAPNVIEVSATPAPHESQERFFVFNVKGDHEATREVEGDAIAVAATLLAVSARVVIVRAESLVDAGVLFARNKGLAY